MYELIKQIKEWMTETGYDYKKEISGIEQNRQKLLANTLTLQDHVRAMVLAMLSGRRRWKCVEDKQRAINAIFCQYDPEELKHADKGLIEREMKAIVAGSQILRKQLQALNQNIEMLEKIEKEIGLNNYLRNTPKEVVFEELSKGKYKLKEMDNSVCEYMKAVGVQIVNPNGGVSEMLPKLGYCAEKTLDAKKVNEICDKIVEELGIDQCEVDTILWQFGNEEKLNICTSDPKCYKCPLRDCPSRKA